jgi:hypothetical protein
MEFSGCFGRRREHMTRKKAGAAKGSERNENALDIQVVQWWRQLWCQILGSILPRPYLASNPSCRLRYFSRELF